MSRNLLVVAMLLLSNAVWASEDLAEEHNCNTCHQVEQKLVGPSYQEIAEKYKDQPDAAATLTTKILEGGSGVWGPIPMPPNPNVSEEDAQALANWILGMTESE